MSCSLTLAVFKSHLIFITLQVVNCKDFGVTILAADGVAVEILGVSDTVTNKDNQPEVEVILVDYLDFKRSYFYRDVFSHMSRQEQAGGSSIETDPAVLCKPCNLVFESDKWCTRHKQSGDHLHVVKVIIHGGSIIGCP